MESEKSPKLFLVMLLIASMFSNMCLGIYAINKKQSIELQKENFSIERKMLMKTIADCTKKINFVYVYLNSIE